MYLHGISELPEAQGGVKQGPRRSQEARESPELQKGGLRALEEAWIKTSRLRYFSVKSLRFPGHLPLGRKGFSSLRRRHPQRYQVLKPRSQVGGETSDSQVQEELAEK